MAPLMLPESLSGVPGFDAESGMSRLSLGGEAYVRVLGSFVSTYEGGFVPATDSSVAGLLLATQSLRDASAAIGAYEIAELAAAVGVECAANPQPEVLEELAAQVQAALSELVAHLRGRLVV